MQPEALLIAPLQAAGFRKPPEFGRADQQAAGKYIGLNEIRARRIGIEQRILHRDELDRRTTTGLQVAGNAIHEGRPVFAPQRLHHFHAGNGIVLPVRIPIVLLEKARVSATLPPRPCQLFIRQADRVDIRPPVGSRAGQRAPSTTDFQHAVALRNLHPVDDRADLLPLRHIERLLRIPGIEERGRIGHRLAQPRRVEIVSQIVMRGNVLRRARPGIALPVMRSPQRAFPSTLRPRCISQRFGVLHEDREQRHRIGAAPLARLPRLIPADRAARGHSHQRAPVMDRDFGFEAGPAPTDQPGAPIGKAPQDGALFEACVHPVDQFVKPGGQQARQEAGLLFEALARCQQIASARLTRYPHTRAFMHPGCRADNPLGPCRVDCSGTRPDQSSFIAR